MAKFKVTMKEVGTEHELVQYAVCETRKEVIEYQPDIEYYRIEEVKEF